MRTKWAAVIVVIWAGVARAETPDLELDSTPVAADAGAAVNAAPIATGTAPAPWGFYRDEQGRVMQVSFDLTRRAYLGAAYAPGRLASGATELGAASFEFGAQEDHVSPDGHTRYRCRFLQGQARVHSLGLDVTALRFDYSHRYTAPFLRVTTFFGEPARHDFWPNVGLLIDAGHLQHEPRGIPGEDVLTLGTLEATLDLWRSDDMRSYLRLRVGPGVEKRFGAWGDHARYVAYVPRVAVEGDFLLGARAFQKLSFQVHGDLLRSVTPDARSLPGGTWVAEAEVAYEWLLVALNDQPVTLRLASTARARDAAAVVEPAAAATSSRWDWRGSAGIRVSFFSPPVPPPSSTPTGAP